MTLYILFVLKYLCYGLRERSRRCEQSSGRTSRLYRDGPGIVGHGHCYGVLVVHVGRVLVLLVAGDLDLRLLYECESGIYCRFNFGRGMLVGCGGG